MWNHFFFSSSFLTEPPLTWTVVEAWSLWRRLRASLCIFALTGKFLITLAALLTSLLIKWVECWRFDCEFFFYFLWLLWSLCLWRIANTLLNFFFDFSLWTWTPTAPVFARPKNISIKRKISITWSRSVVEVSQVERVARKGLAIKLNSKGIIVLCKLPDNVTWDFHLPIDMIVINLPYLLARTTLPLLN